MIEIDGLGDASLPAFLSSEHNPIVQTNDHDDTETSPKKLSVPTKKSKHYNAVNTVAGRIYDMAKVDQEVFKMVMPQLQQMHQNCMPTRDRKSEKTNAARKAVADTQTRLPIVPDTIQRDIADDVNQANTTSNKQNNKKWKANNGVQVAKRKEI